MKDIKSQIDESMETYGFPIVSGTITGKRLWPSFKFIVKFIEGEEDSKFLLEAMDPWEKFKHEAVLMTMGAFYCIETGRIFKILSGEYPAYVAKIVEEEGKPDFEPFTESECIYLGSPIYQS